ncbi:MAG TPA: MBL fold metallo-hydrolase [Terriglobales bacterium]|nr:MBL fold metallo-hydrolase [Terriglobales bacterium]
MSARIRWQPGRLKYTAAIPLLVTLAIPLGLLAQKPTKPPQTQLELVVLGSGGPRSFGRASTSYLILIENRPRILVDAGPGAFLELGKLGLDLAHVDIVLLTHLHIDHSADIPAIFLDRALTADQPIRFKVFGPQGEGLFPSTKQFLQLLFGPGGAYEYEKTFGAEETIEAVDLPIALDSPERNIVSEGDLRVREIATHHGDCPAVAYRIDYKHNSITFSGDMDASAISNLQHLALDSDLLVAHAAVLDPPGSPEILYTLHTPPKQIGQAARDARVKHLLLSHIAPVIEENRRQVLRSIANSYKQSIEFAHDGMRIPVTAAKSSPHHEARAGTPSGQ